MTAHKALPHAQPTDVGLCPERTQRLMDVLRREVDSGRLPGAVAMVARQRASAPCLCTSRQVCSRHKPPTLATHQRPSRGHPAPRHGWPTESF